MQDAPKTVPGFTTAALVPTVKSTAKLNDREVADFDEDSEKAAVSMMHTLTKPIILGLISAKQFMTTFLFPDHLSLPCSSAM